MLPLHPESSPSQEAVSVALDTAHASRLREHLLQKGFAPAPSSQGWALSQGPLSVAFSPLGAITLRGPGSVSTAGALLSWLASISGAPEAPGVLAARATSADPSEAAPAAPGPDEVLQTVKRLREAGANRPEIARSTGLSLIEVDRLLRSPGMPRRNASRDQQVCDLFKQGKTYEQISQVLGLGITREGIRQILKKHGALKEPFEGRTRRKNVRMEADKTDSARVAAVLEAHPGSTLTEVSRQLGISRQRVQQVTPTALRSKLIHDKVGDAGYVGFSDEQILAAISAAAKHQSPLTCAAYERLRSRGDIHGPTLAVIFRRMKTWPQACQRAGVTPSGRRSGAKPRFDAQSCLHFVREFLGDSPSSRGSAEDYSAWRTSRRPEAPSRSTVMNRLGTTEWNYVKRRALGRD